MNRKLKGKKVMLGNAVGEKISYDETMLPLY